MEDVKSLEMEARRSRSHSTGSGSKLKAGAPVVLVIAGADPGAGTSVASIALASALSDHGHRVLLYDASQVQGRLHVLLGAAPATNLLGVLSGETESEELLRPLARGLWLLPGESGAEESYSLGPLDRARLHVRLGTLHRHFDVSVVDAGPGVENAVRLAALGVSRLVVVVSPDPSRLPETRALIRIAYRRLPGLPIDVLVGRSRSRSEARCLYEALVETTHDPPAWKPAFLGSLREDGGALARTGDPSVLLAHLAKRASPIARRLARFAGLLSATEGLGGTVDTRGDSIHGERD